MTINEIKDSKEFKELLTTVGLIAEYQHRGLDSIIDDIYKNEHEIDSKRKELDELLNRPMNTKEDIESRERCIKDMMLLTRQKGTLEAIYNMVNASTKIRSAAKQMFDLPKGEYIHGLAEK